MGAGEIVRRVAIDEGMQFRLCLGRGKGKRRQQKRQRNDCAPSGVIVIQGSPLRNLLFNSLGFAVCSHYIFRSQFAATLKLV